MESKPDSRREEGHPSLAVIVPMYNEEAGAPRCVVTIVPVLRSLSIDARLIVVDDGSRDRTGSLLESLREGLAEHLTVVAHPVNRGYGAALRSGVVEAVRRGFTHAIFMDSDLTNDPKFIPAFVDGLSHGYDCVKASRYIAGGGMAGVPFHRRMISRLGNALAAGLFGLGIRDCTNGFRCVRLEMLKDFVPRENGFPIIMEEMYHLMKRGATFAEIPNVLTARADGATHFGYTPRMFVQYLKYALRAFFLRRTS